MTQCCMHGPRHAVPGRSVRVDVVIHDAPTRIPLRIRLEQLTPGPRTHVDEWTAFVTRPGTTTVSFVWRAAELGARGTGGETAVLRATVWAKDLLSACTHGVVLAAGRRSAGQRTRTDGGGAGPSNLRVRPRANGHPHPLLHQGRGDLA
jgi:hypothetical protein